MNYWNKPRGIGSQTTEANPSYFGIRRIPKDDLWSMVVEEVIMEEDQVFVDNVSGRYRRFLEHVLTP